MRARSRYARISSRVAILWLALFEDSLTSWEPPYLRIGPDTLSAPVWAVAASGRASIRIGSFFISLNRWRPAFGVRKAPPADLDRGRVSRAEPISALWGVPWPYL